MIYIIKNMFCFIRYADDVEEGDEVLTTMNDKLVPAEVTTITKAILKGKYECSILNTKDYTTVQFSLNNTCSLCNLGAYAPLTTEGNILVDGILASCYASSHHDLGHLTLAPMRYFPELMDLIFGQSNNYPGYVKVAEDFGKMVSPYTYGIN